MQILRPANIVTSAADGLAGIALACYFLNVSLPFSSDAIFVVLATLFLYAGGIVYNDVFDYKIDQIERPQRPIPSGKVNIKAANVVGALCFALGVVCAAMVHLYTGWLAVSIVVMCFVYNAKAKHHLIAGPLVMGSCRGLNLLLGISIFPAALSHWYIALIPLVYIASVTNISRGEVYGDNKKAMQVSVVLYAFVLAYLLYSCYESGNFYAIAMIAAFATMIYKPLLLAIKTLQPSDIQKSVKFGVLALILLNASWAAISGFLWLAIFILLLLPLSIYLSKKFSVT